MRARVKLVLYRAYERRLAGRLPADRVPRHVGVILDGKLWSSRIAGLDPDRWTELGVRLESSADVVHHSYERQFRAFFEALAADRDMPRTSLAESARTFEVVFAADRSAALGRPVRLDEVHAA